MAIASLRDQLQAALGDSYRFERELAPGGMSRLFLATERSLDRLVVIKVLPPEYASEVSAARFQREVTVTAQLQHPHILPILSAGSKEGLLYYVMPYVKGESLRQRLERDGRLPVALAVQILRETADALAQAHKAEIVHRDIKPENILLQEDHALLADFGVARALSEAAGSQRLTETGTGLGTPGYMAPEQLAGERNVDARADVYALAVVGYEMLAGAAPFVGANAQQTAAAHFTSAPKPLSQVRVDVPFGISDAISKALAKEPDRRFASAAGFRDALTGTASATGRLVPIGARRVAIAMVAALITGGSVMVWRSTHGGHESRGEPGSPVRLVVLPFENLGDSVDAYFADGVSDAIRDKLALVPGLEVIATTSSREYRHTTKPPQQIGRELDVRYLLTGNVRWSKSAGGVNRVQVKPELVEAGTAVDRWNEAFEAPLTDVFTVQGDIGLKVAQALQLTLSPTTRQDINRPPTSSVEAYQWLVRGDGVSGTGQAGRAPLTTAAADYANAVRVDPRFALAWARLSRVHSQLYRFYGLKPSWADSANAESARAHEIAPQLAETYGALGDYYGSVLADSARALSAYRDGLRFTPASPLLLSALGGGEAFFGRFDSALVHLKQAEQLDPRNTVTLAYLGQAHLYLRRYEEAAAAFGRLQRVAPNSPDGATWRAIVSVAQGNLGGARAVLHEARSTVDSVALLLRVADLDAPWLLDSESQRALVALRPSERGGILWGMAFAETYWLRGDRLRARAYADSAVSALQVAIITKPDMCISAYEALGLSYMGRRADALAQIRTARNSETSVSAFIKAYCGELIARAYVALGESEQAIDLVETLLAEPGALSPAMLRIDPDYLPLRGNPRFDQLVADTTHRPSS